MFIIICINCISDNFSVVFPLVDDLNTMYKVAACEVAIVGSHYWTDLLRVSDLDLLEYADDLQVCLSLQTVT